MKFRIKRIRTDSAIYIINLIGQPYSNDAIDQYRAQKFISSPQGLEMSLIFVRNVLSFLQKSSTAFSNNVAVLYKAGSIVQTAFHHAVISGFFGWILKEIPTGICGIYVSHCVKWLLRTCRLTCLKLFVFCRLNGCRVISWRHKIEKFYEVGNFIFFMEIFLVWVRFLSWNFFWGG